MNMRETTRLGDLCTVVSGTTPKTGNDEYWDGDILWVTPAELTEESFIINDTARKITDKAIKESGLKSFPEGTVLLSSRAPIGKVAIAGKEMYCNQGFKNFICNDELNNEYLYWFLKGKNEYLNSLGRGATFKEISKSIVENIYIPLPGLDEQIHISSVLSKCQSVIKHRKEQIKQLDNLIKSRFVELFGKVNDKIMLKELCDVSGGYSFKSTDIINEGIKLLQISNVALNKLNWDVKNYLPLEFEEKYSNFLMEKDDIVMALTRPIIQSLGNVKTCIVNDSDLPCLLNQRVGKIKVKDMNQTKAQFIYHCFMTEEFTRYVEACCIGCSQPNISTKDIESYGIPDVSIELQDKFAVFVQQVEKLKVKVKNSLDETQVLFDSLMLKYFD